MVAKAGVFPDWTDFPRGMKVLLVGKDITHINDVRFNLERCHYIVTVHRRSEDAVAALENGASTFHLAMVEAMKDDEFDGFRILKAAGDVPTIMIIETENIATFMESIALGAADILQKPLTEEKLRNIWQHVARKALIAGGKNLPAKQQRDPGDALLQSMHGAYPETEDSSSHDASMHEHDVRCSSDGTTSRGIKLPASDEAPSSLGLPTQQLTRGSSWEDMLDFSPMSDDLSEVKFELEDIKKEVVVSTHESPYSEIMFADCTNSKVEFDNSFDNIAVSNEMILDGDERPEAEMDVNLFSGLPDSDSDSALDFSFELVGCCRFQHTENEEEEDFLLSELGRAEEDSFGTDMLDSFLQSPTRNGESKTEKHIDQFNSERNAKNSNSSIVRKKTKVDWTAELHHKFVQAVEQLGVDKAIPSKILELMGVKCLTRYNIASHLQKYRSHRKHHMFREARIANWRNSRPSDCSSWAGTKRDGNSLSSHKSNLAPIQPRLPVGMYTIQPAGTFSRPPLHVWGHPTLDHSSAHTWHQPPIAVPTTWQSPDGTIWQHPATSFDGWVPVSPAPGAPPLSNPFVKVPLAPASQMVQVGLPVIPLREESLDYPADSAESEMSAGAGSSSVEKSSILHPPKEVVDAVINEALRNPITLPLGLKPPSMESVIAELQKKGISGIGISAS